MRGMIQIFQKLSRKVEKVTCTHIEALERPGWSITTYCLGNKILRDYSKI